MTTADVLDRARQSFERHAWGDAYAQLSALERQGSLEPEDLERFAIVAHLVGRDVESADLWARTYHELVRRGNTVRAARCAFWLAFSLLLQGELARSGGWLARGRRLLHDGQYDCVEQGYLLVPIGLRYLFEGNTATAYTTGTDIVKVGEHFGDPDLMIHGQILCGRALIRLGQVSGGVAVLDEIIVAVTDGEVSPIVVGLAYCAVIEACQEIFDLRRAQEWTAALNHWCASQPGLVPYRGQCLVHRAEIMQLYGAWREAMVEAERACQRLSQTAGRPWVGAAFYQQAELHRLRGQFADAEEAYREANKWGRDPQPGLAQLRLAQGRVAAAEAAIRRAVDEAQDRATRTRLLGAYVEIMLVAKNLPAARAAAEELAQIATALPAPFLRAVSIHAAGAVLLSEGDALGALVVLRCTWRAWEELAAPYEAARARILIGLACRELGDDDAAEMELDAARWTFRQLGAVPDLARVEALSRKAANRAESGLTAREVQVLRLVAAGKRNREIATTLVISDHTVRRHLQNIFIKLDVSSRAAATAYALQHHLI